MFDPAKADQLVRQGGDFGARALHHHHLQAVLGVEVDVQRGEDAGVVPVLALQQLVGEAADFVVVHQGNGADDLAAVVVLGGPIVRYQIIPDGVAHGFRARRVALPGADLVERGQQIGGDGDREAGDGVWHLAGCSGAVVADGAGKFLRGFRWTYCVVRSRTAYSVSRRDGARTLRNTYHAIRTTATRLSGVSGGGQIPSSALAIMK